MKQQETKQQETKQQETKQQETKQRDDATSTDIVKLIKKAKIQTGFTFSSKPRFTLFCNYESIDAWSRKDKIMDDQIANRQKDRQTNGSTTLCTNSLGEERVATGFKLFFALCLSLRVSLCLARCMIMRACVSSCCCSVCLYLFLCLSVSISLYVSL